MKVARGDDEQTDGSAVSGLRPRSCACRILVVDDNRDAAELAAELLRMRGHQVQLAFSGAEALSIAREDPPDLAFFDLGMPQMDGYALARAFRADASLRNVALVALTGWGAASDRARTARSGFDAHLVKPADLDALESSIVTVLAQRSHAAL